MLFQSTSLTMHAASVREVFFMKKSAMKITSMILFRKEA